MSQITKTTTEILYSWLNWRQLQNRPIIRNSDMAECKKFGEDNFGQSHNAATYERQFRKARDDYGWRFEDVSDKYPNSKEKAWKIKPKPDDNG